MKYYLCIVGEFKEGNEDIIIDECLQKNIYQYHQSTSQKGVGPSIKSGDTLILVFKKEIIGYGIADGKLGDLQGYETEWKAVKIKGEWVRVPEKSKVSLPYGVYGHTIKGNKRSVVKEIDSLWANELIWQIVLSDRHSRLEFPREPVMHFHLPTIATFLQKDYLKIPPVQRGKVWNATRVEVLWDSIMRNIPIGTIDIRPVDGGWEILDGQQRTNSIAMGYQSFSESEQAILWLDIDRVSSCVEEEQTKIDRKFFFRVTTVAHPWGYKLSDDETKNIPLKHWEQKAAVEGLSWENSKKPGARPYPYELWPIDAIFPVPFTVLRSFFESHSEGDFDEFRKYCGEEYKDSNWYNHIKVKSVPEDIWKCFSTAIGSLNNKVVLAQNSINVADEDIGLYFKRLNKSGIEPDAEEISYSLLKSKVPELKELDKIAVNRMRPSRLANIAMRTYLIQKNTRWMIAIDHKCIRELVSDAEFQSFVKKEFAEKLDKIESWVLYEKTTNPPGIPRVLYSQLARRHPDIFCFLITLTDSIKNCDTKFLIAIITLLMWFGDKIDMGDCYKILQDHPDQSFETNIKTWLFEAICRKHIIIPPPIEIFNGIVEAAKTEKMENVKAAWSVPAYIDGINRIWYWNSEQGRGLLLYVVREYLQNNFGDYDPVDAVWNEENRPWDYDHIFPQDWLCSGRGNSHGESHELVSEFIHSIGNIAPISFSKNRGKQATQPGKYQGNVDNNLLYVNHCEFFDQHRTHLEHDSDLAFKFAEITASRMLALYKDWYETLKIGDLLDFSDIDNPRRRLFEKLLKENTNFKVFFSIKNGTQIELQSPAKVDWARSWLACGMLSEITIEDKPQPCFICIGSDGLSYKVGILRHPDHYNINGNKDDWWFSVEVFDVNTDFEKLEKKLKSVLDDNQVNSKPDH